MWFFIKFSLNIKEFDLMLKKIELFLKKCYELLLMKQHENLLMTQERCSKFMNMTTGISDISLFQPSADSRVLQVNKISTTSLFNMPRFESYSFTLHFEILMRRLNSYICHYITNAMKLVGRMESDYWNKRGNWTDTVSRWSRIRNFIWMWIVIWIAK